MNLLKSIKKQERFCRNLLKTILLLINSGLNGFTGEESLVHKQMMECVDSFVHKKEKVGLDLSAHLK